MKTHAKLMTADSKLQKLDSTSSNSVQSEIVQNSEISRHLKNACFTPNLTTKFHMQNGRNHFSAIAIAKQPYAMWPGMKPSHRAQKIGLSQTLSIQLNGLQALFYTRDYLSCRTRFSSKIHPIGKRYHSTSRGCCSRPSAWIRKR